LQAVASITLSKTRTRLNLKKLYAADGAAVRELLKLAQLLHKATHTVSTFEEVRCAGWLACSMLQEEQSASVPHGMHVCWLRLPWQQRHARTAARRKPLN
jgi:hypothetical protein